MPVLSRWSRSLTGQPPDPQHFGVGALRRSVWTMGLLTQQLKTGAGLWPDGRMTPILQRWGSHAASGCGHHIWSNVSQSSAGRPRDPRHSNVEVIGRFIWAMGTTTPKQKAECGCIV